MQDYCVCDLETTGLEPRQDQIIEIGLVKVQQGEIKETFESLVNPGTLLPVKVKRLTGLQDDIFKESPFLSDIAPDIIEFIGDLPLVGHNVSFDASFLAWHLGIEIPKQFDTLELARIICPDSPRHRLHDLCVSLNIELSHRHRALSDARATAQLSFALMHKVQNLSLAYLARVNNFLKQADSAWIAYTASIIKDKMRTLTGEGLKISYPLPDTVKKRKPRPSQITEIIPVNKEYIKSLFSATGPLKDQLSYFEVRPQQAQMAGAVTDSLNENKCLLMEAGTGTGKSLAYLIPSLEWALANRQRTLIATQTINLQEQLWTKDIPILKSTLENDFCAALVKGRSNYLCLRRWETVLDRELQLKEEEAHFFARILVWLGKTETGDKGELNLSKKEQEYWLQICSDPEICQSSYCRWFHRHCFVGRARMKAENADIIITNHSLLFSDLRSEHKILPSFGPLIIDEAHHLEDAATSHLGKQVSRVVVRQWLQSIYKTAGKLTALIPPSEDRQWQEDLNNIRKERQNAGQQVTQFAQSIGMSLKPLGNESFFKTAIRLRPNEDIHQFLKSEGANLITTLKSVMQSLKELLILLEMFGESDELWLEHAWNIKELIISGDNITSDLEFIIGVKDENHVYWVEINGDSDFNLVAAPVRVGELLFKSLFKHERGLVLTSATLTANESFQYFIERTGINLLPAEKVLTKVVPSPFNYDQQCILCVDNNIDIPGSVPEETYFNQLAESIAEYILAMDGRTLILFTSHNALRETYNRLKGPMEQVDICLLGHNLDGGRTHLIEQFRESPRSVLLGASSFWEGVDIPGSALCNVIIVKLPFWPPNMPVVEARLEELDSSGLNGFSHFTLPQAVIRLKQGFGRLIRTGRDKGSVIIMDRRVITKRYGKVFLNSLPIKTHIRGDTGIIKKRIANWLQNPEPPPRWTSIKDTNDIKRNLEMWRKRHI